MVLVKTELKYILWFLINSFLNTTKWKIFVRKITKKTIILKDQMLRVSLISTGHIVVFGISWLVAQNG